MYGFSSFYWDIAELREQDQRAVRALNALSAPEPHLGYVTNDLDGLLAAFRTLLDSDDVRARGVALDQYAYAGAQHRWGLANPMAGMAGEVLRRAQELLAVDPGPGPAPDEHVVSCWNSALGAMAFVDDGTAADLPRIVEVLETALPHDVLDLYAFTVLRTRLAAAAEAGDHGDLAALLGHPELRLATCAARALLGGPLDEAVRRAVAAWPADAPDPADVVRQRIEEADELAAARAALGRNRNVDEVVAALRTLRSDGEAFDVPGVLGLFADRELYAAIAGHDPALLAETLEHCLLWAELPDHHDELVALLGHDDPVPSVAAGYALIRRGLAEPLVRRAASRWPGDAPEPAGEVREALADLAELVEARKLLTSPAWVDADLATLTEAVDSIADHGDEGDVSALLALVDGIDAVAGRFTRDEAGRFARKLRRALLWHLPEGDDEDPRYPAAEARLAGLVASPA